MKQSAIGIFDSGIGGLTVAHAIKKQLPNENLIYFGDTQHLPYGEKSEKSINLFSKKITSFLIQKKCKAIIIACNSAASVANKTVLKVAKNIPVFNVIDPVVKYIDEKYKNSAANIGIIGTKATIQSKNYEKKITTLNSKLNVSSLQTPLLAPMIEEGFIKGDISQKIIIFFRISFNIFIMTFTINLIFYFRFRTVTIKINIIYIFIYISRSYFYRILIMIIIKHINFLNFILIEFNFI